MRFFAIWKSRLLLQKPRFGGRVGGEKGQKLLILGAMKIEHTMKAPRAGTVTAILISNGQPVEFGQPLFVIE